MGDADITLRHISRHHSEAIARAYVAGGPIEVVGWGDTQLTAVERRLDRTLFLRLAGELHELGIEFEYQYESDLPDRVHEYRGLSRMSFRAEHPGTPPPPMETVVILLTGRRKRWPTEGSLRTGWRGRRFSGTHFRIDAIYQRTVAELIKRGSPFWLVFAPLARDATVERLRGVVAAIRAQVPNNNNRGDLLTALLVMADVDPWAHNMREELEAMIQHESTDLIRVSKTLRTAYEKGIQQMLHSLFAKRIHRALTAREQEAIALRSTSDPEHAQEKALILEGEALAAWLLTPDPTPPAPPAATRERPARKRRSAAPAA